MTRKPIAPPKTAKELLDMYYPTMRSALLETAAAFDRIQRGRGYEQVVTSPPLARLRQALAILADERAGRTERFLELLSEE